MSLPRYPEQRHTNWSEVISVYTYDSATAYGNNDALQRFGKLKIKDASFTISAPVDTLEVSAVRYALATEEQRRILETVYEVSPFNIQTITLLDASALNLKITFISETKRLNYNSTSYN